ncbi:MAG: PTS sugar transporter subunit IIA [Planctomycetota bacterium]|nr:PTS sugar transporter subunit IIA [Planctomycetota bacterium]
MPTRTPDFWKLFDPKGCSVRLKSANKEDTLAELIKNLRSGGLLDEATAERAHSALLEREKAASTGIGKGIAIPHVKVQGLESAVASLSIHPTGLDWQALDREPVQIVFTVLRPDQAGESHDPEQHIEMMRWVARLAQDVDFRNFAVRVKNKKELVSLLKEKAGL